MLSKGDDSQWEEVPDMDEGWWASVLADESTYATEHQETLIRSESLPELYLVDWKRVQEIYDRDEIVILEVNGFNRGGLLVKGDGLQGFVPVSHLVEIPGNIDEEERRRKLCEYVGHTLRLKVIECEPSLERIVLSERAALAGEGRRKQLFQSLKNGDVVQGIVTNVTDFGVFVDLGGVEGLIHVSELSWGRVQHPSDVLKVGHEVQTLVLQISEENSRVALSLKRLYANPWDDLAEKYKPGDVASAVVTSVMHYGVFARLNEGVEGLIHVSSMGNVSSAKELEKLFHCGQSVRVQILHIDIHRRRLGLGLVNQE